jgi:hypothetical protein
VTIDGHEAFRHRVNTDHFKKLVQVKLAG